MIEYQNTPGVPLTSLLQFTRRATSCQYWPWRGTLHHPTYRWRTTLKRLPVRYRKAYATRHTSVSWNLMVGRNPLRVAKDHGHSVATMWRIYSAWMEGAGDTDIDVAMQTPFALEAPPPRKRVVAGMRRRSLKCQARTALSGSQRGLRIRRWRPRAHLALAAGAEHLSSELLT